MENKKDLTTIALAALILASATPVNGQANINADGIFLAAGCPAHGCPAAKNGGGDSTPNAGNEYYNPHTSYPSGGDYNYQSNGKSKPPTDNNPNRYLDGSNREYNRTTDDGYNRAAVSASNSSATLTEAQLVDVLSSQGRTIYLSLDPEGKALAIQLASQDSYRDKNLAVKEAQRRMNERRSVLNR